MYVGPFVIEEVHLKALPREEAKWVYSYFETMLSRLNKILLLMARGSNVSMETANELTQMEAVGPWTKLQPLDKHLVDKCKNLEYIEWKEVDMDLFQHFQRPCKYFEDGVSKDLNVILHDDMVPRA